MEVSDSDSFFYSLFLCLAYSEWNRPYLVENPPPVLIQNSCLDPVSCAYLQLWYYLIRAAPLRPLAATLRSLKEKHVSLTPNTR
jgi:hypothetical protein